MEILKVYGICKLLGSISYTFKNQLEIQHAKSNLPEKYSGVKRNHTIMIAYINSTYNYTDFLGCDKTLMLEPQELLDFFPNFQTHLYENCYFLLIERCI